MPIMLAQTAVFLSWVCMTIATGIPQPVADQLATKQPNIIFFLVDDMDSQLGSLNYMQGVQTHLMSQGATYNNHYCTVSLCCPSRANIWTGRAAHNTNVTDLFPPYGGYPKFIRGGFNDDWLPLWMQRGGYQTYYVGKLFNAYEWDNYDKPYVKGFNASDILTGSGNNGTYNYYNPVYQANNGDHHDPPREYKNQYTTDLLWNKSAALLDHARQFQQPFFLTMAPVAPHGGGGPRPAGATAPGPVPNEKYVDYFKDIRVPRTENFNPDIPSGLSWIKTLPKLTAKQIENGDEFYRNRLRALQSVDEVVNNTMAYLSQHNLLDSTYIIFSSDNGYHIGNHRQRPGKSCPYEEDINVPMVIRGPTIKAGSSVNVATTHTDIAPTILRLGQVPLPDYLDGTAIPLVDPNPSSQNFEYAQVQYWGRGGLSSYPGIEGLQNNTYKSLRILGQGYSYLYSVWCTNEHELYDMTIDPTQMHNLYKSYTYQPNEPLRDAKGKYSINRLESRLDALLLVLKSCKASTCYQPWSALHPEGDVASLVDAMDPKYDRFYEQKQNRVSFDWCDQGYIIAAEGPQNYFQYSSSAV